MKKFAEKARRAIALVSEKTNPTPKGGSWPTMYDGFKFERKWCLVHAMLGTLSLFTLALDAWFGKNAVIDTFVLALNCGIAYMHFLHMLNIKIRVYSDKVLTLSDRFLDEYETIVLKMAVSWPELPPPDRKSYGTAKKHAEKIRKIHDRLSSLGCNYPELFVPNETTVVEPAV